MRRARQQLSKEETWKILEENTSGVLSLCGHEGKPYGVPLSYVLDKDTLYFHCALEGYKLDLIKENPNACFTIIDKDVIVPEKFTTKFRSVILQGPIQIVQDEEKRKAIELLGKKYSPQFSATEEIESSWNRFLILALKIEEATGKQAIEYLK